jgi:hypothetical protein
MKPIIQTLSLVFTFLSPVVITDCIACSMCKVTINGHTYLGNNEDSWRMGSRIWFENGKPGKLGCVYVGYSDLPQGGMNEAGLAFDGLTTLPKAIRSKRQKKEISNPTDFLKEIMQSCETTDDVKAFAIQYSRQKFFNQGEYLFADRAGNYLVMEADTLINGSDDKYLIANFCPSITSEKQKQSFARYKRGEIFLQNHFYDTSSNFCFALTDTMHECRQRIGDGTMYSFVADLDKGKLTLCFYHDFQHPLTFNLKQELAKGDHVLQMAAIFPTNAEYLKFLNFKTPQNNTGLLLFLFFSGGLFAFSSLFFFTKVFMERRELAKEKATINIKILLGVIGLILVYYMTVLYNHQEVFYFPAPYKDFKFSILNIAAYIPFLLLVLIVPLVRMNVRIFSTSSWGSFSKSLFVLNNLFYLTLIVLFFYWGFYSVF